MIKKENKTLRITLDPETNELLNSLAQSYSKSKTEIIKVALRILAKSGKKPHYITIGFFEPKEVKTKLTKEQLYTPIQETPKDEEFNQLIEKLNQSKEEEPSGELPFEL